jgi:hypothetical protein
LEGGPLLRRFGRHRKKTCIPANQPLIERGLSKKIQRSSEALNMPQEMTAYTSPKINLTPRASFQYLYAWLALIKIS